MTFVVPPEPWPSAFVAALGAIFGSFLNVCIHRLPRGESVVTPRSRCPACKSEIRAYQNAPLKPKGDVNA
jgi:leader peptidase (prepilin peptidase)/N-methyltransferase